MKKRDIVPIYKRLERSEETLEKIREDLEEILTFMYPKPKEKINISAIENKLASLHTRMYKANGSLIGANLSLGKLLYPDDYY
jgi:hypothetical protein